MRLCWCAYNLLHSPVAPYFLRALLLFLVLVLNKLSLSFLTVFFWKNFYDEILIWIFKRRLSFLRKLRIVVAKSKKIGTQQYILQMHYSNLYLMCTVTCILPFREVKIRTTRINDNGRACPFKANYNFFQQTIFFVKIRNFCENLFVVAWLSSTGFSSFTFATLITFSFRKVSGYFIQWFRILEFKFPFKVSWNLEKNVKHSLEWTSESFRCTLNDIHNYCEGECVSYIAWRFLPGVTRSGNSLRVLKKFFRPVFVFNWILCQLKFTLIFANVESTNSWCFLHGLILFAFACTARLKGQKYSSLSLAQLANRLVWASPSLKNSLLDLTEDENNPRKIKPLLVAGLASSVSIPSSPPIRVTRPASRALPSSKNNIIGHPVTFIYVHLHCNVRHVLVRLT